MTTVRPAKHIGARRLAVKARLAGWDVRAIARWLDYDVERVRRWLRGCGRTLQGHQGCYVFDAMRSASLGLTVDELIATGAWPEDNGRWDARGMTATRCRNVTGSCPRAARLDSQFPGS